MGRDNSNAGQRILNARATLRGSDDSLENMIGRALQDGAQCFVTEAQSTYRYLSQCKLPDDGEHIVTPRGDNAGRWVRETGLVGFALLEGGKLDDDQLFRGYTYQKLVQFETTPDVLVYIGSVPRLAHLSASTGLSMMLISVVLQQGEPRVVASGRGAVSGSAILHPGEQIVLRAEAERRAEGIGPASLQVVLT